MTRIFLWIIFALICEVGFAGNTGTVTDGQIIMSLQSDADTLAFVDYVKKNGQNPKSFMLDKLANHKLVIYGESHKRKASWDLMKSIIKDPSFSKKTGIVFLEMPSDCQVKMDSFFANKTMDKEILLDILRSVQIEGWDDRGMYEFVIDLWSLDKGLAENEKIKVVLVDIPRPYYSLKTKEEFDNYFNKLPDRNQQIADVIEESMISCKDKRSGLFIVGFGHTLKSVVEIAGRPYVSAGVQLKKRFSDQGVYIAFAHTAIEDNVGNLGGLICNGIFDYAFKQNGNNPTAFNLASSPFGKKRFDAVMGLDSLEGIGNYENYFDGYIFLMPLKDEGPKYLLSELITEDFIQELRRRASIFGNDNWRVYGVKAINITMEDVQAYYQKTAQSKYWGKLNVN